MEKFLNQKPFCMDFHEVQSNLFRYLKDNYGEEETISIITSISKETWSPLIKDLKNNGLIAIENHLRDVMDLEKGKYNIKRDNKKLIFNVEECPCFFGISHIYFMYKR